jgi:membrane protein DedA with SNARE-associated domain
MDFLLEPLLDMYGPWPYLVIFGVLLACGMGLPIPEDVTLFVAGVLAYYGVCNIYTVIAVSMVGVIFGDSLMWWLGRHYGRALTQKWIFRKLLHEDRLDAVAKRLKANKGERLLFAARFMPGLRAPFFFSAGILHVPYAKFIFYDGMAAILSVPAIVGCVYYFGDNLDQVIRTIKKAEYGIIATIVAGILFLIVKWYWQMRRNAGAAKGA